MQITRYSSNVIVVNNLVIYIFLHECMCMILLTLDLSVFVLNMMKNVEKTIFKSGIDSDV